MRFRYSSRICCLRELRVDHQRERRFADLAAVRLLVRQKQRPRELLRQRAAAFDRCPRPRMSRTDRAAERNRIDAGVMEEAVILDRDERVLQQRECRRAARPAGARPSGTSGGRRPQGTRCRRRRGAACGRPRPAAASTSAETAVRTTSAPKMTRGNAVARSEAEGDPGNHERRAAAARAA